MSAVISAS
jgi:hypothetical protein